MATRKDYVVEAQKRYDVVAGMSDGMVRSPEQRQAERVAYDRLQRAKEMAERSGAGRGTAPASAYKRKTRR